MAKQERSMLSFAFADVCARLVRNTSCGLADMNPNSLVNITDLIWGDLVLAGFVVELHRAV